ncbi:Apses transcription factor [Neofusicoccum parvum]|nr:Apses transcription factor [Neofusicoccum parvum]
MQVAPSGMAGFEGRAASFTPTQPQAHRALYGDSVPPQQNGFARSFSESNGLSQHHMDHPPQIYTAVYSNVNVYEMEINGIAVMKRRSDSWLNATQILKVAGVDKGKRTKVLEKEILTGEHEKVQGGYGKYQGTWINYRRGREFCRQYGVEDLLRPLLDYGMEGGPQGHEVDTPTKEQAMAANRKRFYASTMDGRTQSAAAGGTFFSNISSTASNAIAAMNKVARMNSPAPRPGSAQRRHMASTPSRPGFGSQESFRGESQQSVPGLRSERSFSANGGDSTYATQSQADGVLDGTEPPRKRLRQEDSFSQRNGDGELIRDGTPTEANDSFVYHQPGHHLSTVDGDVPAALPPLPGPSDAPSQEKQAALLDLFQDNQSRTDYSNHPAIVHLSGTDLDMPLDQSANTALHWAATLARVSIMRLLISKGANIFRGNAAGQTPLMAAVAVNNCLDHSCFPELLELLAPLIEVRDDSGRTILHHIAVASGVKGRAASSKYYLEALLEFLVRSNTGQNSQSFEGSTSKPIGLMRFMSEMVNARDVAGNTALNLVARIGNRSIIQQLLEVKADPTIPNYKGLRPLDFGVGEDPEKNHHQALSQVGSPSKNRGPASRVEEASREMMPAMSSFLSQTESQFNAEIRLKQDLIDKTNVSIQTLSTQQRHLSNLVASLQRRQRLRVERSQRITNLKNAIKDQRGRLARSGSVSVEQAMDASKDSVKVGDADTASPLSVKLGQLRDMSPDSANNLDLSALSPSQHSSLLSLPTFSKLRVILSAYDGNNAELRARAAGLRERNGELEAQYRKVVSLCTGVAEDQVELLLGSLVKAVESEIGEGVEVGRVKEFLRKVDFVEN